MKKQSRFELNVRALNQLLALASECPDLRFFQLLSNYFGLQYLGYADDPTGKNFHDLFHAELELSSQDIKGRKK